LEVVIVMSLNCTSSVDSASTLLPARNVISITRRDIWETSRRMGLYGVEIYINREENKTEYPVVFSIEN